MPATVLQLPRTDHISAYAHCGIVHGRDAEGCSSLRLVDPLFRALWHVFDQYIHSTGDVPWWYTERSIVGHMTAACFAANMVAMEEYGCDKGQDDKVASGEKKKRGRVDFWFGASDPKSNDYWAVESKACYVPCERVSWNASIAKLNVASGQVKSYQHMRGIRRLAMCFVRLYYAASKQPNGLFEQWCGESAKCPSEGHYYGYYWLREEYLRDRKSSPAVTLKGYFHPALIILCKEAGRA